MKLLPNRDILGKKLKKQKALHFMIFPALIWMVIFCYWPISGNIIAFKEYRFDKGILHSPFVGLANFKEFFIDPNILLVIRNTFALSLVKICLSLPITLVFAIMLDELSNKKVKRTVQTISYFPYFISWPVVLIMASSWFSPSIGIVNDVLVKIGIIKSPYYFLGEPEAFRIMMGLLEVWKNTGWGSIIYLAALAGINPELYESAYIDGVTRFKKIWHITIPSIIPTISVVFILNIGNMLQGGMFSSNFQQALLFGNQVNNPTSEILDTYIFKTGVSLGRYSYASAVGLLTGIVSLVLIKSANFFSKKLTNESLI